jgi:endoglucanase
LRAVPQELPVGGTGAAEKRVAARPSLCHARAAMDGLLHNIEFSACTMNNGYLKALGLKAS